MAEISLVVLTAALVLVTGWYALLTKRIAEASKRSARTTLEAAEAAARSAAAAEAALLAEAMPFVLPSFGGGGTAADSLALRRKQPSPGLDGAVA